MLHLTGRTFNGKLEGTVTIFGIPYASHYLLATVQQRIVLQTSGGTEFVEEDQILHGVRNEGRFAEDK